MFFFTIKPKLKSTTVNKSEMFELYKNCTASETYASYKMTIKKLTKSC